jgi:hypothetical protein
VQEPWDPLPALAVSRHSCSTSESSVSCTPLPFPRSDPSEPRNLVRQSHRVSGRLTVSIFSLGSNYWLVAGRATPCAMRAPYAPCHAPTCAWRARGAALVGRPMVVGPCRPGHARHFGLGQPRCASWATRPQELDSIFQFLFLILKLV